MGQLTMTIKNGRGEDVATVNTLDNGITLVTRAFGSLKVRAELHEVLQTLLDEYDELHLIVRHRVG